ncbi:unnamed protein product [Closterium sp. NIES-53]
MPRLTLRQTSPWRPNWSKVKAWLRSFQRGEWEQLYADATKAVKTPPPPRHQPDDASIVSRAEGLAKRGSLHQAVLALESTPVCTPCPAILDELRKKHLPADNVELTWPTASTPNLAIAHADFAKLLSRCKNGVGAGPSGTTFEHLRDASITNATVCTHLHALVNTLLAGNLHGTVADLLRASRLITLSKPRDGARPIAIGKCLTRLAEKAALTVMGETAFLEGQLEEMAKLLPFLERADPQVASLLLTRCISRRVAYLTRTTPLNLLSRNTWSQWGRDLLATLLTSCGIRVPSCSTENSRVWAQASLPPSLGGIGITDPLAEGVHGFLASFTQAALFLTSLTLALDSALAQVRNHMLLPCDATLPLHNWLTGCELALPTDARELLEKETLAQSDLRL